MNISWISPRTRLLPNIKPVLPAWDAEEWILCSSKAFICAHCPYYYQTPHLYIFYLGNFSFSANLGHKTGPACLGGTQRSEYSVLQRRARPLFALWPLLFAFGCALEYCQIGLALGLDSRYSSLPGFSSHFFTFTFYKVFLVVDASFVPYKA